jgi:hypothetical protein
MEYDSSRCISRCIYRSCSTVCKPTMKKYYYYTADTNKPCPYPGMVEKDLKIYEAFERECDNSIRNGLIITSIFIIILVVIGSFRVFCA